MSFWSALFTIEQDPGLPKLKSAAEAYMLILYAVITADKAIYDAEQDLLLTLCRTHPLFQEIDTEVLLERIEACSDQAGGAVNLVRQAASLMSPVQKEAVFIAALDLAMADGQTQQPETLLLNELEQVLGINSVLATHARDVIGRKYAG